MICDVININFDQTFLAHWTGPNAFIINLENNFPIKKIGLIWGKLKFTLVPKLLFMSICLNAFVDPKMGIWNWIMQIYWLSLLNGGIEPPC